MIKKILLKIISRKNIIELLKNNIFFIKKFRKLYYKKLIYDELHPYHFFTKGFGEQKKIT